MPIKLQLRQSPLKYLLFVNITTNYVLVLVSGGGPRWSSNAGPESGSEPAGSQARFLVRSLPRRSMGADLRKI